MKTLMIAHRGDTVNHQENTMEAFTSAFGHGADGIEIDVHFYNGKLVVVHDYLFDRSKTYPNLSEVLTAFASKGRLEIEIKCMDLEFLPALKTLIQEYEDADIEITTSVWPLAHHLRQNFPKSNLGIIFLNKEFEDWMTEEFICTKILKMTDLMTGNVAHIPWQILANTPSVLVRLHEKRIKVHSHILNSDIEEELEIYKRMCDMGIDQCTFDDINLLEAV